jgi:Gram-negative bacterial TonB protein C-terminal/TonB-dependent Receptor Plug Domain
LPGVMIVQGQGFVRNQVRFRGKTGCAPLTWLDGHPLPAGEFDLDGLSPNSIEAMEVYAGSTVPPRFAVSPGIGQRTCGAIVIWSREAPPRRTARQNTTESAASELADLVENHQIYTAAQVDITAHQDSLRPVRPTYPDALLDAEIGGRVMAEFIVNPMGEVDVERLNIVFATHPALAEAVRHALETAVYIPAIKGGYPVHQVVQHEFVFRPDSGRKKP